MIDSNKKIKFAFGSVPKDSGTFTFYRNLRPALLEHGIEMYCVAVGKEQARLWETAYEDEGCVLLASDTWNVKRQARAFVNWCVEAQITIVMGINSEAILSAIPHLPQEIRVLARCANAFDHGYRITLVGRERLEAIVALSPRLRKDLIEKYEANPNLLHLIPNGIAPAPFEAAAERMRGQNPKLQLGFLGRLEHKQKGVLHLPKIVQALNAKNIPFELRIAGKGKHRLALEQELQMEIQAGQVKMLGAITPKQVPQFLAETDVFVFTSHFEGIPNALLEAIMAGCVSVSWIIDGITDFVLEDEKTGFLLSTADYEGMANRVAALHENRALLQDISKAAAKIARKRFLPEQTAEAYTKVIKQVLSKPSPAWTPKAWRDFEVDENFRLSSFGRFKQFVKRIFFS